MSTVTPVLAATPGVQTWDDGEASSLLSTLASIKAAEDMLAKQKVEAQTRLIELLDGVGIKTYKTKTSDGRSLTGTLVQAERLVYDEPGLEAALGKKLWDAVTVRKLDKALLEAHVVTKAVDENVVAAYTEVKQNAPYIKMGGDTLMPVPGLIPVSTVASGSGKDKPAIKRVKAKRAAAAKLAGN